MIEVDSFILEVKKRPVIWDPEHLNYFKRPHKIHAWHHVAVALIKKFTKFPPKEKAKTGMYANKFMLFFNKIMYYTLNKVMLNSTNQGFMYVLIQLSK